MDAEQPSSVTSSTPLTRTFVAEAHLDRDRRLTVSPDGVAFELGIGVRHVLLWADCATVLRTGNRIEAILDETTSVLVRAGDWYCGDEALDLIERVVPADLLVVLPGEPETDPMPFRLSGLATTSSVVHGIAIAAAMLLALVIVGIGVDNGSVVMVFVGCAVAASSVPFALAMRRRLAVPRRWRQSAAVAGRAQIRIDHGLGRLPDAGLDAAVWGLPLVGVLGCIALVLTTHVFAYYLLVLGLGLGIRAHVERLRRRHR